MFIKGIFEKEVLTGRQSLLTALERTLPAMGYRGSPLAVVSYWLGRDSHLNFQLLDVIRKLRRVSRGRLYVATNQEHMRAFHLWNRLGMETMFDDIFYSARLGVLKPDAAFFERITAIIGPQDQPPLLFDDSEPVIEGARAFGWEAVLYDELADCVSHPWIAETLGDPIDSAEAQGRRDRRRLVRGREPHPRAVAPAGGGAGRRLPARCRELERVREHFGFAFASEDYREVLARKPDIVVVSTPHQPHYAQARATPSRPARTCCARSR